MNFVVSSGVVLMPKYWESGMPQIIKEKYEKAFAVLQKAFPDMEIVQNRCLRHKSWQRSNALRHTTGIGG